MKVYKLIITWTSFLYSEFRLYLLRLFFLNMLFKCVYLFICLSLSPSIYLSSTFMYVFSHYSPKRMIRRIRKNTRFTVACLRSKNRWTSQATLTAACIRWIVQLSIFRKSLIISLACLLISRQMRSLLWSYYIWSSTSEPGQREIHDGTGTLK